jgi:hypothetical protein
VSRIKTNQILNHDAILVQNSRTLRPAALSIRAAKLRGNVGMKTATQMHSREERMRKFRSVLDGN